MPRVFVRQLIRQSSALAYTAVDRKTEDRKIHGNMGCLAAEYIHRGQYLENPTGVAALTLTRIAYKLTLYA